MRRAEIYPAVPGGSAEWRRRPRSESATSSATTATFAPSQAPAIHIRNISPPFPCVTP